MSKRYRSVDLEEGAEGLVLFSDVMDRQENVLLPQGTQLTASLIRSLERRGIESVLVEDGSMSEEELAIERARVGERLQQLFRHCGTRACARLRSAVEQYRMDALS